MSNDNTTPVVETENEVLVQDIPVVKTKKELKKERKEIKKHKKQVKKEARMHSAKMTKFNRFLTTVISLIVIVAMLVCTFSAIKITANIGKTPAVENEQADDNTPATPSTPSNPSTPSTPSNPTGDDSASEGDNSADTNVAAGDLSTKEGVVEYFKTAHAKVLSEAKSATRIYDNTTNYESYLEVGGNDTLAGVAKQLMGMFMKENTEQLPYTGADIATNFPPTKNSCAGLTADMIGEYSCKEEGDNYVITLTLNSSKESPDLGDNSAHLVSIVESKTVEEAAAGFVSFEGLKNEYIAPTVTATINKTTGQMTELHTLTPSYMKFDKATVAIFINVNNVGIGLQYEQKWTIEW
ncbi:MAG: hypothetical protein IKM66_07745 [Clostridia bacterium]|nr:hypothetical protein [Clostridia bacterium]